MRTEDDLRDAIEVLAGRGPDAATVVDRIGAANGTENHVDGLVSAPVDRRHRAPGRVLAPLVAAAVVAAVAVTGVVAFGHDRHGRTSAGGTTSPLQWTFSVGRVAGYAIARNSISRPSRPAGNTDEILHVAATGGRRTSGSIEFDSAPGRLIGSAHVSTVAGVHYYFRPGRHVTRQGGLTRAQYADPWKAAGQDAHGPRLAWHYSDGSQFFIYGSFGFNPHTYDYDNRAARAALLSLALAVRPGRHDAATMPFHVRSLPGGLVPVSLREIPRGQQDPPGSLGGALPLSACLNVATRRRPSPLDPTESVLTICRAQVRTSRSATLDAIGFGPQFVAEQVVRRLSDGTLLAVGLGIGHSRGISRSELRSIAERVDTSPTLSDASTWLDVN